MNSDLIYLEEKFQNSQPIVYLYILRLPTSPSEQNQLQEIIRKNNIKVIFNFGTQSLTFLTERVLHISQDISKEIAIEYMHQELKTKQSNIALICSKNCKRSLQFYFHYMDKIEQKRFSEFNLKLFEHKYSIEELSKQYEEINKPQNITIFDYDLLKTKSNIVQQMSSCEFQSEIITKEQPKYDQIKPQINYQYLDTTQIYNQKRSNILGNEDQVVSMFYSEPINFQPGNKFNEKPSCYESGLIQEENKPNQLPQHQLKFESKYKLPEGITFINYIQKEGFKCLE